MARDVEFSVTADDRTGAALAAAERHFTESQKRIDKINKDHAAKRQSDLDESAAKIGRRLESVFGRAAPKLAQSLAQSMSSAGPAIVGALAVTAPLIGGLLSAGIIGGAGAGGIIGGVLLAAQDPRVKTAGTKLGQNLLNQLTASAAPFVQPVLKAIETVETRFKMMNGRISSIFSNSSGFLAPLVDGTLDAVQGVLRGFDALVRRGEPVMQSLGRSLGILGNSVGNAFETISGGSEDAADAFEMTAHAVGAFIEATGYLIRGLTELFGVVSYIPQKLLGVSDALSRLTGVGREYNLGAQASADATVRVGDAVTGLVNKASGLYYTYESTGEAADRTNAYLEASEKAMLDAANAAAGLITANHSLYDSETNLGAAIDRATEARKKNGKTLDANTEKGRANRDALSAVASAAENQYQAFVKVNGEGPKSAALADTLRGKFIGLAQKLGASKTEANNLANSILNIPSKKDVKIKAESNALQASREAKAAINSINSKTVTVNVQVNASRLASIENRLNRLGGSMYNAANTSWAASDMNSGTARTGGPTPVSVNNSVDVFLDGTPFYAMTVQASRARSERDAWRQKVGRV